MTTATNVLRPLPNTRRVHKIARMLVADGIRPELAFPAARTCNIAQRLILPIPHKHKLTGFRNERRRSLVKWYETDRDADRFRHSMPRRLRARCVHPIDQSDF